MSDLRRVPLLIIRIIPIALVVMSVGFARLASSWQGEEQTTSATNIAPQVVVAVSETTVISPTPSMLPASPTVTRTATQIPSATPRPPLPTAPANLGDQWQEMPIVPEVSPAMKLVYERGLALGNDPQAFSKVGDCNTETNFFLAPFDQAGDYRLGSYAELQAVIDHFAGSFSRPSIAARSGFGPGAMFDPIWADPKVCLADEGPLACEFRLQRPSLALIGLGTHYPPLADFEARMRAVIEFSLEQGVVPILATKVDMEGGDRVNAIIVYLAQQYEVPLWNFWRAEQPLYNHGQPEGDGIHFTWARNYFDNPSALRNGWPVRNLTGLQTLYAVWSAVAP